MKCKCCKKEPSEILEYVSRAEQHNYDSPEDFVRSEEGTYNNKTDLFYCTDCYIKAGMPLGTA